MTIYWCIMCVLLTSRNFVSYIFLKRIVVIVLGDKEQERDWEKEREKDEDREWSRGSDRGRGFLANRRGSRSRFPGGPRRFPGRYSRYASGIIEISELY